MIAIILLVAAATGNLSAFHVGMSMEFAIVFWWMTMFLWGPLVALPLWGVHEFIQLVRRHS